MARIRTIKPEFPQSESMGRVSRDARLLFILLWTICDDAGRSRGDARLLKGLLYPYDEVTFKQIEAWLTELEGEGCLVLYSREGSRYVAIRNWLTHQKIDKPSKSKFPDPPETVENPREDSRGCREGSSWDLRIGGSKDQGPKDLDREGSGEGNSPAAPARRGQARASAIDPEFELTDARADYARSTLPNVDAAELMAGFRDHHTARGTTRKDWDATWRTWVRNALKFGYPMLRQSTAPTARELKFDANGRQVAAV